ncbi:MAG: carbonic anhydrase [Chlamydiae bacterium]|nr:carbonic anhydrase [Chlamydiota bacterium]
MMKLVQGILEFRKLHLSNYRDRFSHLAMGQKPDSLFITCSDSRVVPNLFTSTHPGHLFVVRNAGNIVPPHEVLSSERASIEFAVSQLPIENIIVCGHSNCGAMQALMEGKEKLPQSLNYWLSFGQDPRSCESVERLAKENVLKQIEHLKTYPIIKEKMDQGLLKLWGWYFDVGTGDVFAYEEEVQSFLLIDSIEGEYILSRLKSLHEKHKNLGTI